MLILIDSQNRHLINGFAILWLDILYLFMWYSVIILY